jgi:hypothetical protein
MKFSYLIMLSDLIWVNKQVVFYNFVPHLIKVLRNDYKVTIKYLLIVFYQRFFILFVGIWNSNWISLFLFFDFNLTANYIETQNGMGAARIRNFCVCVCVCVCVFFFHFSTQISTQQTRQINLEVVAFWLVLWFKLKQIENK